MQLVPYLGIDAACLDAHVKTLGSSAQEFDLAPIARQSLPGLEVATEPALVVVRKVHPTTDATLTW
jgi:hypothetical protein